MLKRVGKLQGEVLWNCGNDARAPAGVYILAEHSRFDSLCLP